MVLESVPDDAVEILNPSTLSASRPVPVPSTVNSLDNTSAAVYEEVDTLALRADCKPVTSAIAKVCIAGFKSTHELLELLYIKSK